jgi:hypothetical protein
MIGEYGRIRLWVSPDETQEKVLTLVSLAQGNLDLIRVTMDGIYTASSGAVNARDADDGAALGLPSLSVGLGPSSFSQIEVPPLEAMGSYDSFWEAFDQVIMTAAQWEDVFFPSDGPGGPIQVAMVEEAPNADAPVAEAQVVPGQAGDAPASETPAQPVEAPDAAAHAAKASHPAAVAAHRARDAARLAGGGLLGGLFAWAGKAEKTVADAERETRDKDALAHLDEKLRNRRYKSWDDVMHG